MNPRTRQILVAVVAGVVAIWLGSELASGAYFWPGLAALAALAGLIIHLLKLEGDVILLGLVLFGYIVGNRGFAQFMPIPGVPLLPAEAALVLGLGWRLVRAAFARRLPFARHRLHYVILAWLVVGAVRFGFDLPRHGFLAVRDFAVVYYALFFFIAWDMARHPAARRYLIGCVLSGCAVLAFTFPLSEAFPVFFMTTLQLGAAPLIYYKSDIALSFFAAGGILLFHWAEGRRRYWAWPLASGMFFFSIVGDVRAVMVGGVLVMLLLAMARRWAFPLLQGGLALLALLGLIVVSTLTGNVWADHKLTEVRAQVGSVVSIAAPSSEFAPKSYKLDNNRFRLVWWHSVALETWETNPVFGLGFGHDLAAGFLQEYDQDLGDDFVTRSPHCIAVTALGRMGAVGFGVWIAFCIVFVSRCWRALRHGDPLEVGLWCSLGVLLVSATFGVVLEGPMGAVVFWAMLGLTADTAPAKIAQNETAATPPLQAAPETVSA